jgi:hypothetical protein
MNFIACAPWLFFRGNYWNLEPISEPRFGQDMARACWILRSFLTQLLYHNAKVFVSSPWSGPHTICSSFLCVSRFPCRYEKNAIMTCVVATGLVYLFN